MALILGDNQMGRITQRKNAMWVMYLLMFCLMVLIGEGFNAAVGAFFVGGVILVVLRLYR
jgi:hypothetical protein